MKNIFNTFGYMIFLLFILLGSSCNDWLDVKPQAQMESDDLYSKEKGFEDALIACYIKMNSVNLYGQNLSFTFTEYLAQFWDFTSGNRKEERTLKDFNYTTSFAETNIQAIYGELYNTIAQANSVLENIQSHGTSIKEASLRQLIEAEAIAIRAFCHTDILRLFGQVPQNSTIAVQLPYATQVSNQPIPYYAYDAFIKLIFQDIETAQHLLKNCDPVLKYTFNELDRFTELANVTVASSFMGYRRFRFNYWALEALKARLYLYIGDKANARIAANNVIHAQTENGQKILELSGDNDLKNNYFTCPSECILALSNNKIEDNASLMFNYTGGIFLTSTHFNELFAGQETSTNNRALKTWKDASQAQGKTYKELQKYKQPNKEDVSNESLFMLKYQAIPLLRLSEMYLIAIETAQDAKEANALYKTYMEARNVMVSDLSLPELQNEVINEYRREFFAEGQMFYTYKRLGIKKMLWKNDREVVEKDYILPLPSSELGSN